MIYVGIDVAKDKHDCFITNSDGEVLFKPFTITNNLDGFNELYQKIESVTEDATKVKVGLEATGHYSYNLLGYLIDKGLAAYVINPLHTNLYRKSLSLRQTKTDKVDARTIASMLMSDVNLKHLIKPANVASGSGTPAAIYKSCSSAGNSSGLFTILITARHLSIFF